MDQKRRPAVSGLGRHGQRPGGQSLLDDLCFQQPLLPRERLYRTNYPQQEGSDVRYAKGALASVLLRAGVAP